MTKIFVIIHDNGIKGQEGATEYTMSEVWKNGGINAILEKYRSSGVHVYTWYETTI